MSEETMGLVDHLRELRFRLIRSLYGILLGMGVCLYFAENLLSIIRKPVQPFLPSGGLVFTGVMDKFMAHIKIGLLGGAILTCPYWLYHVWKFISPGLYQKERKYAVGFIFSGTILFLFGVCFAYFVVYPAAFEYLFSIGGNTDKPMITIDQYLSFFMITTLAFGLSFELPVVLVLLALMGVVDAQMLRSKRRYAVLIQAVVAAIITPPDLISMMMMLGPMLVLYEIAILIIVFLGKNNSVSSA